MASLEFDIGLEGSPEPEKNVSSTASSAVSSMLSTAKSKFGGGSSANKSSSASTYSEYSVFIILRDFLQPNTALSLESVIESLTDLLPENASGSAEVYSFGVICLDLAEQIPYHHPSHQKMARLLEYFGKSTKVNAKISQKGKSPIYNRYQGLGEYVYDRYSDPQEENPGEYVNYHAFVANLEQCHVFHSDPTYAVCAMRDAFEKNQEDKPVSIRDAYVLGAAQWILWNGQNLFTQIRYPGDLLPKDKSQKRSLEEPDHHEPLLTLQKWHFWRDRFRAVAGEKHEASDECKAVAVKAADMMDAFEKNMAF